MKKSWYKMKAKADAPKAAEISIYDEIGYWGVTAAAFISELKSLGEIDVLDVSINSPGGSVFDGLAIYNALRGHKATVNVTVMGIAASMASVIAMAGDKITMPENTFMMVHNPWGVAVGNADEMRDTADILDKIGSSLMGIYVARTGKSEAEVKSLLDGETYMTAAEAKDLGFVDEVVPGKSLSASFDLDKLPEGAAKVLAAFKAAQEPENDEGDPEGDPEVDPDEVDPLADAAAKLAAAAGLSDYAADFALACKDIGEIKARIGEAREITALCALAKQPGAAVALIREGKSLADARASLIASRATTDEATHTCGVPRLNASSAPTQPSAVKATTADIWAKRRNQL